MTKIENKDSSISYSVMKTYFDSIFNQYNDFNISSTDWTKKAFFIEISF